MVTLEERSLLLGAYRSEDDTPARATTALAHLTALATGETIDPDTGLSHLTLAIRLLSASLR